MSYIVTKGKRTGGHSTSSSGENNPIPPRLLPPKSWSGRIMYRRLWIGANLLNTAAASPRGGLSGKGNEIEGFHDERELAGKPKVILGSLSYHGRYEMCCALQRRKGTDVESITPKSSQIIIITAKDARQFPKQNSGYLKYYCTRHLEVILIRKRQKHIAFKHHAYTFYFTSTNATKYNRFALSMQQVYDFLTDENRRVQYHYS